MKTDKYLIPLNLQLFADGDNDDVDQNTVDSGAFDPEDWQDLQEIDSEEEEEAESEEEEEVSSEEEEEVASEESVEEQKRPQSKEDNARFAEQRRQREFQERMQQTPEYQALTQLAAMYGQTPEQMVQAINDMRLQKQAQEQNVPVEVIKQMQELESRVKSQENDTMTYKFKVWETRVDNEAKALREGNLSFLSDEEIEAAKVAMVTPPQSGGFGNPDMSLEQAVFALHHKKITDTLAKGAHQEALAKQAGRDKKAVIPPAGTKPAPSDVLSAQEKYTARLFGMSDAEYLKAKKMK